MRPDVKLGVAISMVLVFVAGGYFMYRGGGHEPIPVGGDEGTEGQRDEAGKDTLARRPSNVPARPRGDTATPPRRTPTRREVAGSRRGATPVRRSTQPPENPPTANGVASDTRPTPTQPSDLKESGEASSPDLPEGGNLPASTTKVAQRPEMERTERATDAGKDSIASPDREPGPRSLLAATAPAPERSAATKTDERHVAVETHRIQAGDTMSSLAERYYGSSRYTRFLIQSNPQIPDPNWLRLGMSVRIPPKPADGAKSAASPAAVPPVGDSGRTYRVRPGDTFYGIARDALGDSSRWKELFELNKQAVSGDPTNLQVGQVITLPSR